MPAFVKGPGSASVPFGRNEFLRSTKDVKRESYTLAKNSVPAQTVDATTQKITQPGLVLAKITSGPDIGKVGPFRVAGTNEVQTATKAGTWTSGTYDITVLGVTVTAVPMASTAAQLKTLLVAAGVDTDSLTITGGPLSTTPLVFTFVGSVSGSSDVDAIVIDTTNIAGGGTAGVVEGPKGVAGATDGRQTLANIVGILETFLPWQLLETDVDVAVVYQATVVQAWCFELNAAGLYIALTDTTAAAMVAQKRLNLNFV
jgi:hypothetical protein